MVKAVASPAPDEVRAARARAGHTQGQAAEVALAGSYRSWQDWESGRRKMPPASYELYLLKTGQKALE